MTKAVILFPGQGSQKNDMAGAQLQPTFNKASEILGYDLLEIIKNPVELNKTKYTQPAVFVASIAWLNYLDFSNKSIAFYIGHSLGEWTAAVATGCISFENGLRAVSLRANLMEKASDGGGMAAVLGINDEQISKEIENFGNIKIANYNLPNQTVISGDLKSIIKYSQTTKAKVIPLKVAGAFHSPYMQDAHNEFKKTLENIEFEDASIPIILNATSRPETNGKLIKDSLIGQLTKPVYFYQSVDYALKQGVNLFYEAGPSKILTNMVKKLNESIKTFAAEDIDLKHPNINNFTNLEKGKVGF